MSEIWKQHPDYPNHQISDQGQVRQFRRGMVGRLHKFTINYKGYETVRLTAWDGSSKLRFVHQLVLETFVGYRPTTKHEGAHKNGRRTDNRLENLAWKTPSENQADRIAHGTSNRGAQNPMYKHGKYIGSKCRAL